ncbi:hypothetical protein CXF35_10210 [Corynebacterium bovis]|uniref:Uncharacterized protein n=2 Tax=Corynebacterium bovis TaxID=36808 RepID=A0A3R8VX44_9CORY|nr:hypothetical protein CXF40_04110 [Corynebacterium bovis]RRO94196.1 hypothetical protein CXF32_09425 [Corynebacterium bovis]RRO99829.1 hypothetical protein CXF41_08525 [Corynebacterium bovis]RRQ02671.1 hypothetical protein CXF39_05900 [Corynebacterium bovis]RRQ03819.1 hypothetical protein CXF42_06150 [Corynebacterium bovis]
MAVMREDSLYGLLGLDPDEDPAVLVHRIERRMDAAQPGDTARVDDLLLARELLGDPLRKAEYDRRLATLPRDTRRRWPRRWSRRTPGVVRRRPWALRRTGQVAAGPLAATVVLTAVALAVAVTAVTGRGPWTLRHRRRARTHAR